MKYSKLFSVVGVLTYMVIGISGLVVSARTLNAPMLVIQEVNDFEQNFRGKDSLDGSKPKKEVEQKIRSFLSKNAKNLSETEVKNYSKLINRLSYRHKLSAGLVLSVVRVESNFKTWAVSNKGAVGLMQIMPETGEWLCKRIGIPWQGPAQLLDPEVNLALGTYYLSYLKNKYQGNLVYMLAAYNRGPAKVDEDVANGKDSTTEYYYKVKTNLPKITLAQYGG